MCRLFPFREYHFHLKCPTATHQPRLLLEFQNLYIRNLESSSGSPMNQSHAVTSSGFHFLGSFGSNLQSSSQSIFLLMIFTKQIRLLFVLPLMICAIAIYMTSFAPWFAEVYSNILDFEQFLDAQHDVTIPQFYPMYCNVQLATNGTTIYNNNQQYYTVTNGVQTCVIQPEEYHSMDEVPENIRKQIIEADRYNRMVLINQLNGDTSRIIQITLSIATIGIVILVTVINHYSRRIAYLIADPIDDLTLSLRNIDKQNLDSYFSEMLQGEKSQSTPGEMLLLLRSVYDFIKIVNIANEAFKQGNDSQAIIEYAVANQFYIENGNNLGAGVIQNNMGVLNIRNSRYTDGIQCFKEAIICILNEWDNYKRKYSKYGIVEEELLIDEEYQNLSSIVFNRCFNLCEALSEFLLQDSQSLQDLLRINDIMFILRRQLLGTHDFKNAVIIQDIKMMNDDDKNIIIQQLWTDTTKAYEYCVEVMKYQMNSKSQRQLYITLKLLIGKVSTNNLAEAEELIPKAEEQFNNCVEEDICPLSLLRQKFYLYKAMYYLKRGSNQQAAGLLIDSLTVEEKFSAKDRFQALQMLRSLLEISNQPVKEIDGFLQCYEPITRDYILVLESSERMRNDLCIIRGSRILQQIAEYINQPNDRMSYGLLSDQYYEMMPLLNTQQHAAYIKRQVSLVPKPKGRLNQQLSKIAKRYRPHSNIKKIKGQDHLMENGKPTSRYLRLFIYVCYDYKPEALEGFTQVMFELNENSTNSSYKDHEWLRAVAQFEQLKIESTGSNFFVEQTI